MSFSKEDLKEIMELAGVADDKMEIYDETYDDIIKKEEFEFKADNIIEASKMNISSHNFSINVKPEHVDKVQKTTINGKKCLVIELDEVTMINGIAVE